MESETSDFAGITDSITNILSNVGAIASSYYTNLAVVNAQQYAAEQARLGTPAQQAAAGANDVLGSMAQYMPYLIGAIALIGVGNMLKK